MDTKICTKCGHEKDVEDFRWKKRPNGYKRDSHCKPCLMEGVQAGKRKHSLKWKSWFKKIYGEIPYCECCGKELEYGFRETGRKPNPKTARFDHIKDCHIKGSPLNWIGCRAFNEKNKELWLECDFHILCNQCNLQAGSYVNRIKMLKNLLAYAERTSKC